jgi:fructan beta-fructosidase
MTKYFKKACLLSSTILLTTSTAIADSQLLFENSDFEKGTLQNWTAEGDAMTTQPTKGDQMAARKRGSNMIQGNYWLGTAEAFNEKTGQPGARLGNAPTGRISSVEFTINQPYITFKIAGGEDSTTLGVNLIVEGKELMGSANIKFSESLVPMSFDVRKMVGKKAKILIYDNKDNNRGFISADDFRGSDTAVGTVFTPIPKVTLKDEWSTFPQYKRVGYNQSLRPQFHFSSRIGWLNDPNGMVYYDGEWHMYFQHYAKGNASGAKSWGSAVSPDLVHWEQLPHAINPYANVKFPQGNNHAIWSGSAVVDELNALGKQKGDIKTLYGIYTATHAGEDKKAAFFQGAIYSTDRGRTWTKINDGKPVIDHQVGRSGGQRDPRIFYYPQGKYYVVIMMVGGKDRAVRLWKSTDLMNWEIMGDIPNKAAECIDMYTVAVDGDKNNMKWIIADAGTNYEIGSFDGTKWTGSGQKDKNGRALKFDFGDSYYAAQVFNQGPQGRVVHVGWLRSKKTGFRPFLEAGMPFTQQMSIPAEITLKTTPGGIRMYRNPVKEIAKLYTKTDLFESLSPKEANTKLASLNPELIDMTIEFTPQGNLSLDIRGLKVNYDDTKKEFTYNNSVRVEGEKAAILALPAARQRKYRDTGLRTIPAPTINGKIKLRVLVDRASLELFVNDGQAAASFVAVPDAKNRNINIQADSKLKINSIVVNELGSSWAKQ